MLEKIKTLVRKDNVVVLFGNLLASAFGLVTFMLLARLLDKSDFGSWAIFISASGLLELMKTGLIRQALVRELSLKKESNNDEITISSALVLTILSSGILAILVASTGLIIKNESLQLFFNYYPLFSIFSIVSNFATWLAHAKGNFLKMNLVRVFVNTLFLLFVGFGFFAELNLQSIIFGYLGANFIVSFYCYFADIKQISYRSFSYSRIKELLAFGKHSLATLTGANLLKSADSLIIGWLMGTEAVAIYAVPLKVLDLLEIPLRGFVMTSFRKLTSLYAINELEAFKNHLFQSIKIQTSIFIIGASIMFFIPEFIVGVIGGAGFEQSSSLIRLFLIPMILLPMDKFLGISLDAANLPKLNAMKVWIMVVVNIIGDIIVIQTIGELWAVALVTILNIVAGIIFGALVNPCLRNPIRGLSTAI